MKTRPRILPSLLALAAFQGVSYAALVEIGVNFIGRNSDQPLAVNDTAGVDPQQDWNNLGNNLGGEPSGNFAIGGLTTVTSSTLFTDDGLAGTRGTTGITLSVTAADSWNSVGPTGTSNEKLMKGIVLLHVFHRDRHEFRWHLHPRQ
jgi:hypothetical protein